MTNPNTTDEARLLELAGRCEQATARQRDGGLQLDGDIAKAMGWTYRYREATHTWGWCRPGNDTHFDSLPPRFSTSLDAAMTLVPEGMDHGYATIPNEDILRADRHHAQAYVDGRCPKFTKYYRAEAATPALALCAAALRAHTKGTRP